jgi:hypothetical protein
MSTVNNIEPATSTKNIQSVLASMEDAHKIGQSTTYKHLKRYCTILLAKRVEEGMGNPESTFTPDMWGYEADTVALMKEYHELVTELDYLMAEDMYVAWEPKEK